MFYLVTVFMLWLLEVVTYTLREPSSYCLLLSELIVQVLRLWFWKVVWEGLWLYIYLCFCSIGVLDISGPWAGWGSLGWFAGQAGTNHLCSTCSTADSLCTTQHMPASGLLCCMDDTWSQDKACSAHGVWGDPALHIAQGWHGIALHVMKAACRTSPAGYHGLIQSGPGASSQGIQHKS